jgi:hypothetical protein
VAGDDCIEAIRAAQLFRAQGWELLSNVVDDMA